MTKRDCEAFFALIEETLRQCPHTDAGHARRLAARARDLLNEEREKRMPVVVAFDPAWPEKTDRPAA